MLEYDFSTNTNVMFPVKAKVIIQNNTEHPETITDIPKKERNSLELDVRRLETEIDQIQQRLNIIEKFPRNPHPENRAEKENRGFWRSIASRFHPKLKGGKIDGPL